MSEDGDLFACTILVAISHQNVIGVCSDALMQRYKTVISTNTGQPFDDTDLSVFEPCYGYSSDTRLDMCNDAIRRAIVCAFTYLEKYATSQITFLHACVVLDAGRTILDAGSRIRIAMTYTLTPFGATCTACSSVLLVALDDILRRAPEATLLQLIRGYLQVLSDNNSYSSSALTMLVHASATEDDADMWNFLGLVAIGLFTASMEPNGAIRCFTRAANSGSGVYIANLCWALMLKGDVRAVEDTIKRIQHASPATDCTVGLFYVMYSQSKKRRDMALKMLNSSAKAGVLLSAVVLHRLSTRSREDFAGVDTNYMAQRAAIIPFKEHYVFVLASSVTRAGLCFPRDIDLANTLLARAYYTRKSVVRAVICNLLPLET